MAKIYVSEYDMYQLRQGASARLQVEGVPVLWSSEATAITPVSRPSEPSLVDPTKFKGLRPPQFYVVDLPVTNHADKLRPGMTGTARIYGKRMSLGGLGWESLRMVLGRKIW
jgi:hypothetical protein